MSLPLTALVMKIRFSFTREERGLPTLSQGATSPRANTSSYDASGQSGLSPLFAPST